MGGWFTSFTTATKNSFYKGIRYTHNVKKKMKLIIDNAAQLAAPILLFLLF